MRLKINHITEYLYDGPVPYSLQRLRLTPTNQPGQTVHNWAVAVDGAKIEAGYTDQFGNIVELVSTEGERHVVRIVAGGEVETEDRNGVFGPHQGFCPLWLFLRDTTRTKPGKLIRELTRGLNGANELEKLHHLMNTVHQMVEYKPGATGTETTAEQALEQKSGVCQDHAHIFIAAARSMEIPARYISGYLLMDNETSQAASHAWAEAHVPGLGWVGFDPANDHCPDARYVRVASGLCYRDCAPVSGMRIGPQVENLNVAVTVEQVQSQHQSQS